MPMINEPVAELWEYTGSSPRPVVFRFHGYTMNAGDWSTLLPYAAAHPYLDFGHESLPDVPDLVLQWLVEPCGPAQA